MELLHQSGEIIADKYQIIDILGQGSSGTTYKAENLQTGEKVAIKALSLHQLTDWKMLELCEREVKILSQLNHPGIPRYLEYFQVDTAKDRNFYIVQQLAEGKSLAEWVESGWRTDEAGVRQIASQILDILVYLNSQKPPVIHRDIKPQNIIRREDGQIFLVDFGAVSDTYYNTLVRGSTVVGTFGYMAPEQFKGQAVPTTDLYGLGATLLFLLTHRSPAELPTDRLKIDFSRRVQISEPFADWLGKMLEPDVEDRFSSAKEALDVLSRKQVIYKDASDNLKSKIFNKFTVTSFVIVTILASLSLISILPLDSSPKAMCEAIRNQETLTLKIYLAWGGNPNAIYSYTETWGGKSSEDVQEVHEEEHSFSLMECAVKSGNVEAILLLGDVNAKNDSGDTPLLEAARNNWKKVVELLIAKGADVNAKNNSGDTPLVLAIRYSNNKVVELLIAKGANVNAENRDTLLLSAAQNNSKEVVELLIAKGADVNAENRDTLLLSAANRNRKEVVELLIAKGADVNARNNFGDTPLLLALRDYVKEVPKLLIAKGADVNAKNKSGNTPLHNAVKNNNKEMVELLKSHGAKE